MRHVKWWPRARREEDVMLAKRRRRKNVKDFICFFWSVSHKYDSHNQSLLAGDLDLLGDLLGERESLLALLCSLLLLLLLLLGGLLLLLLLLLGLLDLDLDLPLPPLPPLPLSLSSYPRLPRPSPPCLHSLAKWPLSPHW